jgi:3-phenylpropionate/trans-cinnamate dioxygenase ferredoxin reductase subunit
VIGDEIHEAYDRTPLSKHVLLGAADRVPLPVDWAELGVQPRLGETACDLAPEGSGWRVRLAGGGDVLGDGVVAATGAHPLTAPGLDGHPNVFALRSLDDAYALRSALRRKIDVVVLGAGWIGAEVASSAAEIGCVVRVVEPQAAPVWRSLGQTVGRHLVPWYAEAGVELLLGRRVVGASEREVELDDGSRLAADVVVVGAGVAPSTEWLSGSPVELDPRGGSWWTSSWRAYRRAGCTRSATAPSYPSRRYGTRLRPEHWTNAQQAGETVAANVLGGQASHDPVPYFWSKQVGRMLQYSGHHDAVDELVLRGDPADRRWSACWLRAGQPTAVLAVNRPRDVIDARRLLAGEAKLDVSLLTDPETPLAQCVVG